jgi:hypothetical protein
MAAGVTELAGSSVVFVPTSRIVCNSVVLCFSFLPASNACFPLLRPSLGLPSFRVWSTFVEVGGSGKCVNGRALEFEAAAKMRQWTNSRVSERLSIAESSAKKVGSRCP